VIAALTDGAMRYQGLSLTGAERRTLAEYMTGRPIDEVSSAANIGLCGIDPPLGDRPRGPTWNGWSPTPANTHFQPARQAGLTAADVPRLRLRWAFGLPDATSAWSQPTVVGGRVFVGSQAGAVYSLDAKTGCIYWTFAAAAGVRSAVSVGPGRPRDRTRRGSTAAYFSDVKGNVYAVDASTGALFWRRKIDAHPLVRLTGSPTLYAGHLYVPVSSYEESQAAGPRSRYPCCTFRGSVVALDANTGKTVWKTYTIPDAPRPIGTTGEGVRLWGPSGGAIWSAPTIDVKRHMLYVSVGNSYSGPKQATTDAVIALDLGRGRIRWIRQVTPGDLYGCKPGAANCGEQQGLDFDFGASPMLVARAGGGDLVIVGQKSGVAYAMDPDHDGQVLWQYRAGTGGGLGGIQWGTAADGERAYFPVSDITSPEPGGLHAVRLATGERVWYAPPRSSAGAAVRLARRSAEPCGATPRGCAQSAAITVIPGIVFSGSIDGTLRAFSTRDGAVVWEFDTHRPFETTNGIAANGGSINGPAPTVAGGMVYVSSGYGAYGGWFGNVLLAFGVD